MSSEVKKEIELKIAHVLFLDNCRLLQSFQLTNNTP